MTDDCGQSGPCAAKAPGCARHFMGLVAELRAEVEHWKGAAKEHAEAQAAAKSEIARIQIEELKERIARQTDWYQQRFNRLRRWVKEEVEPLSKEVAHRYFSICANGSPAPHESADWTETMHELKLRVEQAEQNIKNLTAERDHFKAMLRERADSLLEAREALEKQALQLRAYERGAKVISAAQK